MIKKSIVALLAGSLLGVAVSAQESSAPMQVALDEAEAAIVGRSPFFADRFLLRLAPGVELDTLRAAWNAQRFVVDEPLMPSIGLYLGHILDGTRVSGAISELNGLSELRYAAPDHLVTSRATVPNDPSYGSQWAHSKMQSALAWDFGQGSKGFVVSVVDGGLMLNHQDISSNLYVNQAEANGTPGFDDDGNGYIDDVNGWNAYGNNGNIPNDGHGTHVNGIVGAVGNNGVGVAGVNWNVSLMPVAGASGSTSTVTKAYNYVLAQKQAWLNSSGTLGANVVSTNSSFGVDYANCMSPAYLPWNDAYEAMGAVGILSCAATMNNNSNVDVTSDTPTGCFSPYMVAVTNTTSADKKNSGAAWGPTMIDLGAPGTGIYSTYSNGGYTNMTGTSMASPQVAGAIAFLNSISSTAFASLRANNPAAAALAMKTVLIQNVDPLPDLQGKTVSGGRLNLFKAATAIDGWSSSGTVTPYGVGLGGANIGTLSSASVPNLGTTFLLDVTGFPNSGSALVLLGTDQANVRLLGGWLLVDPAALITLVPVTLSGGSGSIPLPLPAHPAFLGFTLDVQAAAADSGQVAGFAWSSGLELMIGQ